VNALTELQYLMANHAQPNAIGASYAEAANSFFNNVSAIICNGGWMVGDFSADGSDNWGPDFDPDTVHGAIYPGNIALANPLGYNWWIPSTSTPEEIELGKAFISFMLEPEQQEFTMLQVGGTIPGFPFSQEFLEARAENRLMSEYEGAVTASSTIVPPFEGVVYPSIANPDFPSLLPLLVNGSMSPQELAQELTKRTADATS